MEFKNIRMQKEVEKLKKKLKRMPYIEAYFEGN